MSIRPPKRAVRMGRFSAHGPADAVFPLFCPVRETDWLASWQPGDVFSESGVAELSCVFTSSDKNGQTIWVITAYDASARELQMVRTTPGFTLCLVNIEVAATTAETCEVAVTYSHTALSERGGEFVDGFTEDAYAEIIRMWGRAVNHYLAHGTALAGN